jgi:hypothetical protein
VKTEYGTRTQADQKAATVDRAGSGSACRSRRWSELTGRQRAGVLTLASVELALTATAAVDLARRPRDEVRGHKALWWPILVIQPFGPIAYLILGRRPEERGASAD